MERLSHDLNLALDESNCNKQARKKFSLRRKTRSTGNLPASCLGGTNEDASSSSPPQAAIISQPLSDSDDPQLNQLNQGNVKNRVSHFCPGGNFESDSFNENFSPAKPPNARRKRKFKKMAVDYVENCTEQTSPPIVGTSTNLTTISNSLINTQPSSPFTMITKKKRIFKHNCQDSYKSNVYCGKRKWSHRERSELGEMRERSFSGGCTSKSYFTNKNTPKSYLDFKNSKKFLPIDKVPKFKEKLITPVKSVGVKNGLESALQNITLTSISTSSPLSGGSFNFVYRSPIVKNENIPVFGTLDSKMATALFSQPFLSTNQNNIKNQDLNIKNNKKPHNRKHKNHHKDNNITQLRNPLQFDDPTIDNMDCTVTNELLSSSSISSSDSEEINTNDSDREGDDELTDWPGNEEISSFNRNLNLKLQKPSITAPTKVSAQLVQKFATKKDKFLPKQGLNSYKNKTDISIQKTDIDNGGKEIQIMDDDTMMSDSESILDTFVQGTSHAKLTQSLTSFADIKNAGLLNNNVNEAFFKSFQSLQDNSKINISKDREFYMPRTNFTLQKTSSSDLNLSEKSPQSDHCYSEHSIYFGPPIREIRAGCRRLRDERPGFAILSSANEQLSKFLQDPSQDELKLLHIGNDKEEHEKLASLAKLYSLDMTIEMGRPILKKTSNTTKSIRVENTRLNRQRFLSEFKRRCYGAECVPDQMFSNVSIDICNSADVNNQPVISLESDMCGPSSASVPFQQQNLPPLAKVPTMDDLSQSQDYDQGFSSLGNTPPLDVSDELKSHGRSDGGFSSDAS